MAYKRQEQWNQLPLFTREKLMDRVVKLRERNRPNIKILSDGRVRVADKNGYYRIARNLAEADEFIIELEGCRNNVYFLPGFRSSKWLTPVWMKG